MSMSENDENLGSKALAPEQASASSEVQTSLKSSDVKAPRVRKPRVSRVKKLDESGEGVKEAVVSPADTSAPEGTDEIVQTAKPKRTRTKAASKAEVDLEVPKVPKAPRAPRVPRTPSKVKAKVLVQDDAASSMVAPGGEVADSVSASSAPVILPVSVPEVALDSLSLDNGPASSVNEDRPQAERRGRGLRAVVSRTRRKHTQNNALNSPQGDRQGNMSGNAQENVQSSNAQKQHAQRGSQGSSDNRQQRPSRARAASAAISFDDIVSGRFDDESSIAKSVHVNKRVLLPQPESPKLHKVLAQAGMGSRLEMEQLILEGRISVNSEPAHIGQRIQYGDHVRVNGKEIRVQVAPPPARVLAYHKPAGEIVTNDDPQSRPTVFRKLPRLQQGKWQSIGRLDLNTEGLLLFSSSGDLANALMHPRFGIEREYAVRVLGGLTDEEKQQLRNGVELDDGKAQFKSIEDGGGDGANQWYRVVICEGRNREVRRMIESLGHAVSRLIRIRYGAVVLPSYLRQGQWAELSETELQSLARLVGGKAGSAIQGAKQPGKALPRGKGGATAGGRRFNERNDRNNFRGGSRNAPKNQPDPMKTSLGYIEHEKFIAPAGGGVRRGGRPGSTSGGYGAGSSNSFKRRTPSRRG